jgi:hypothetical protein
MNQAWVVLRGLVWPPVAPIVDAAPGQRAWWATLSLLLVIPFTAVFHHAVFFRPTCMLNSFKPRGQQATDYTLEALRLWLSADPSLYLAVVAAVLVWFVGRRQKPVRLLASPFFISFLPLSLWIWDIPGSGRLICRLCHDGRIVLPAFEHVVRSRDLYLVGIVAYAALFGLTFLAQRSARLEM